MIDFFTSIEPTLILILLSTLVFIGFSGKLILTEWQERQGRIPFLLILMLGLALRLGWIVWVDPQPVSDFKDYYHFALGFYKGHMSFTPIQRHPGPPLVMLYAFWLFGPSVKSIWILNTLISGVLITTVYSLARQMLGLWQGLLAALLMALLPQMIAYNALASSEMISVPFSMVFVWALFDTWKHKNFSLLRWVLLGVLLYGNILIRSTAVLFFPLIPLLVVLQDRPNWKAHLKTFCVLVFVTLSLLSTWLYHQYLITEGGLKLFWGAELGFACAVQYDEQGNYLQGGYISPQQYSFYPKVARYYEAANTPKKLAKAIEMTGVEAMAIIKADPAKYVLNGFSRMEHVLNTAITGIHWSVKGSHKVDHQAKVFRRLGTISTIFWQILMYGCPLALVFYRKNGSPDYQWILWFCAFYLVEWYGFHLLLALSSERYNTQISPFVILLFTAGLSGLIQFVSRRKVTA